MELKKFISDVLDQLQEVKDNENKKRYSVKELEFEVSLQQTDDGKVGVAFWGTGVGLHRENQNTQKVTIKLTPNEINNQNS